MQQFLERSMMGNSVEAWLRAVGIALLIGVAIRLLFWQVVRRMEGWSKKTQTHLDDLVAAVLKKTKIFFLATTAIWGGSLSLVLSAQVDAGLWLVVRIVFIVQGAIWAGAALDHLVNRYRSRVEEDNPGAITGLTALSVVARVVVWAVFLLLFLQNVGVEVTALITGLGIGGIAVALAVQNVLGDLLASLSIIFDRPFEVGDFVIVDDLAGTVQSVGLKTTRMESLTGEQLVFSNSDLLNSRVRNYKRMRERRVLFNVGVVYGTPGEEVKEIPALIERAVAAQPEARFDRCHFKTLGDSALLYEVVYYMRVPEYDIYMNVQQAINLALYESFAERGIEFAYPTQTVHLEGHLGS